MYGYQFVDMSGDGTLDLLVTPPDAGNLSAMLMHYPEDIPQPVGVSTSAADGPHAHSWLVYHNTAERPEHNLLHGVDSVLSIQAFVVAAPAAMAAPGSG